MINNSRFFASHVVSPPSSHPPSITLYQYAICPFCCKTKAFLGYLSLTYEQVEVNPLTKKELNQLNDKSYRKVPVAIIDGVQVNGSDEIIQYLLSSSQRENKNLILSKEEFISSPWVAFANDQLAPILYPNLCSTLSNSYRAFGYVHNVSDFSIPQRYLIQSLGSLAMYFAASKIKKKKGILNEREALHNALSKFENEGLVQNEFSSGKKDTPDLGDIAMYGVLKSVEGLPLQNEILPNDGSTINLWYDRMRAKTSY